MFVMKLRRTRVGFGMVEELEDVLVEVSRLTLSDPVMAIPGGAIAERRKLLSSDIAGCILYCW